MVQPSVARDLLFGRLAVQTGLIDQASLIAALQTWAQAPDRSLEEHILELSPVDPSRGALLESFATTYSRRRQLDPETSGTVAQPQRDPAQASGLSTLLADQQERWGRGERPAAESYLEAHPALLDQPETLLVLIYNEIVLREQRGESPEPEDYARRFPDLADLILDQFAIHRMFQQQGEAACEGATQLDDRAPWGRGVGADPPVVDERFRFLRSHAQGGLGTVAVALDQELNREVALKQIQDRYADDPASRARFLLEAEVTGGLEHPGVVPVYSLGRDGRGRPYYAMRFIQGQSLKQVLSQFHADAAPRSDPGARALELRKLLKRFVDVCNTIAYAHSRGVLHRDLKPDNVMLGAYGETLVVDWGLTKVGGKADGLAAGPPLHVTRDAALTLTGFRMGTPSYMSPEQAAGRLDDLGPASDVYGLGTTLYCLLTGRAPFIRGTVESVLKRVQDGDFPPPREVNPAIDPALEAICLRAMARAPEDRYASALALADDIEQWLADEPVTAWREPFSRRARRWARRHRTAVVSAAAAAVVALVASIALAGLQSVAAERERKLATDEGKAKALALNRLGQVERANNLLGSIFENLNPRTEKKEHKPLPAILGERLSQAAASLEGDAIGDPLTVAKLQDILGKSQDNLGNTSEAIALLIRACRTREALLGANNPDTLTSRNNLATAYLSAGRVDEAIDLFEATLHAREKKLVPDHADTLASRDGLAAAYVSDGRYDDAIKLLETTLKVRESKLRPDHHDVLENRSQLATAYLSADRPDDAIAVYEDLLKLYQVKPGPDHPDTLALRTGLAEAYRTVGRTADAIAMHEATLKKQESTLSPDHPETLNTRGLLAAAYGSAKRTDEAIALYQSTIKLMGSKLDRDHPDTLRCRGELGELYLSAGRAAEAVEILEETLKLRKARFGPDHPDTLTCQTSLAEAYEGVGRTAEAIALLEATLKLQVSKPGPDHRDTLETRANLAADYLDAGRVNDAITIEEETLRLCEAKFGPKGADTLATRSALATAYTSAGRTAEAIAMLEATLKVQEQALAPDDPDTFMTRANLAGAYMSARRTDEGIKLMEGLLKIMESALGVDDRETNLSRHALATFYHSVGRTEEAIALFEARLKAQESELSPVHASTLMTRNLLGNACLSFGRTAKAVEVYEGTLKLYETTRGRTDLYTITARDNLAQINLYAGRAEEAIALYQSTLRDRERKLPAGDPNIYTSRAGLAAAYELAGQAANQEPLSRANLSWTRKEYGPSDPRTTAAMASLGFCLVRLEKWPEAEAILRECLVQREAGEPNAWTTFEARSLLGAALLGRGHPEEAEPLVISGYEGMKAREALIYEIYRSRRVNEAARRIVRLYESWGKAAQAREWSIKLGLAPLPADVFAPALTRR